MKLDFENSQGYRRVIGTPDTVNEAFEIIRGFLQDHNYKSYYTRINFDDFEWEIDVGSHSEFFYLSDLNEDTEKYKEEALGCTKEQ